MDATLLDPSTPLPEDVPTLQGMVRQLLSEVQKLRTENAELKGKLDAALKHRFGRRSERQKPAEPKPISDKPPPRRDPHGRSQLSEKLERREVVHDLTDAEKLCPCCGQVREFIGTAATEQLDLQPAKFFVLCTIKKSYACRHCNPAVVPAEQRLQTAGPAQVGPIAKGLCGPGLLAHVITAKFADHTPLHRLAGQLSRSGVDIAPSTLGGWVSAAAKLLDPLCQLMHRRLLNSRVVHGDDTGVKLRVQEGGKTRKAHLWVGVGDADYPYVVFDFTADYTAASGPEKFFDGYTGYLQADALAQYEGLYRDNKVQHVCCWAHARRKFVAAAEGKDERAKRAVDLIGKLYAIERTLPPLLERSDDPVEAEKRRAREAERLRLRQSQADPILEELKRWAAEQTTVLPKTPLGQALGYLRNNWVALCRYRDAGHLAIDNNLSERTLRVIALGRNNWGVLGSEAGGKSAAVLYSVVGTCKHLGTDPFAYLREALPALFALGEKPTVEQLLDWLPDRWVLRQTSKAAPQLAATG